MGYNSELRNHVIFSRKRCSNQLLGIPPADTNCLQFHVTYWKIGRTVPRLEIVKSCKTSNLHTLLRNHTSLNTQLGVNFAVFVIQSNEICVLRISLKLFYKTIILCKLLASLAPPQAVRLPPPYQRPCPNLLYMYLGIFIH